MAERKLVKMNIWPVTERDCCIPLRQLINDPRGYTQTCLNTKNFYIELVDDIQEFPLPAHYVLIPSAEELVNFEEAVREFVQILDLPAQDRPLKLLRESLNMVYFKDWYYEKAVDQLLNYLRDGGYSIKDVSVKYEIANRILNTCEDVEISDDKIRKLVKSEDNIRVLIGYVCK